MTAHAHDAVWLERVAAYALGADPPGQRSELEAHLAGCAVCREHLSRYREVADALAQGRVEPPRRLFHAVQARLGRERLPEGLRPVLDRFDETLADEGLRAACALLNGRASHRFTGVFRVERSNMVPVEIFDRDESSRESAPPIRLGWTYCSIILSTREPFHTADASNDARLRDHPARRMVRAYCGVPLSDASGGAFGTLCHVDFQPRPVPFDEIPLLVAAAPLVMQSLERT